jgi:hypothetical protein
MWIAHQELAKGPAHPFYQRVNELLEEKKFDEFAEKECAKFYAEKNGFAHCYDTGGMRRTHLRGHPNTLKRLLIHVGAFNLSLIFRSLLGSGTPRELKNRQSALLFLLLILLRRTSEASCPRNSFVSAPQFSRRKNHRYLRYRLRYSTKCRSATGC